ncbi:MAG: hypothetical protein CME70_15820 [Halobacteriovorax sp.]|nr:hypothetical protein [Halobacteriovorax sp.]|tara:strand:+ start:32049 stop:32783 length:735 start_codon:yes stop_codon:yes gene_type:complete
MLKVLSNQGQINSAREELNKLGADTSTGWRRSLFKILYGIRYRSPAQPVSINKSWDTLVILKMIEEHFPDKLNTSIFEMGSYNSEIPVSLWNRGYRKIRASDFNPKGQCINYYANSIDFHVEDFYAPAIPEESLDVMTALSVIEHGYDQKKFLRACQKYLKPGGMVIFTTDYHKEKLSIPEDYRLFDLTYMIFSKEEIENLLEEAKKYDLELVSDVQWGDSEYPIEFLGHNMTFILIAFRKKAK